MISVVILSSKAPQKLIDQLKEQTYKDFEIILATEAGPIIAMNSALNKAKGDITVRIDDDVWLPDTWLEELIKPFSDPSVGGVTGPTFVPHDRIQNRDSISMAECPNAFTTWLFDGDPHAPAKIYKCGSVSYGSNFYDFTSYDHIDHLEGTNWAMRTHLIRKVGGFDTKFDGVGEWFDTDVEQKIIKLGYKLVYNPKAYLYHMLKKGEHYNERYNGFGRIKNWLRFHFRHSKFHPKMLLWLFIMTGYFIERNIRKLIRY